MGALQKVKEFFFPKYFTTFKPIDYKESVKILHSNGSDFMERYRSLMRINHPDLGGSPYICMKINEAKNFLLEDKKELSQMDKGE